MKKKMCIELAVYRIDGVMTSLNSTIHNLINYKKLKMPNLKMTISNKLKLLATLECCFKGNI